MGKRRQRAELEQDSDFSRPKKRQKNFTFKKLGQRIAEVHVDVYRSLAAVRAEPLPGSSSFFQEELGKWRERSTAPHFLTAAATVQNLTQTLPQLIHHKGAIMEALMGGLIMEGAESLQPLLGLSAAFARDLQADFVPFFPRLMQRLARLISSGLDRTPETVQLVFECVSKICRDLCHQLSADLPGALKATVGLRYSHASYVRGLAAQSLGLLFRHAGNTAHKRGLLALYAEQAIRPTEERTDGAGLLVAEAAKGANHSLHSQASRLLSLLFAQDLLDPSRFSAGQAGGEGFSQEALGFKAAAIADVAVKALLWHLKPGQAAPLYTLACQACRQKMATATADAAPGMALARHLELLAEMAKWRRGALINNPLELLKLADDLVEPAEEVAGGSQSDPGEAIILSHQKLAFIEALFTLHASRQDDQATNELLEHARRWQASGNFLTAFPRSEVIIFLGTLLDMHGVGHEAIKEWSAPVLSTLCSAVADPGSPSAEADVALPLLQEACTLLLGKGCLTKIAAASDALTSFHRSSSFPLLNAWASTSLAAGLECVQSLHEKAVKATPWDQSPVHKAWAALHLLPYMSSPSEVQRHSKQLLLAANASLEYLQPPAVDWVNPQPSEWDLAAFMATEASRAMHQAASALQPQGPSEVAAILCSLLQWPQSYHAVSFSVELANALTQRDDIPPACWAEVGKAAHGAGDMLWTNLSHPAKPMRRATLQLLAALPEQVLVSLGPVSQPGHAAALSGEGNGRKSEAALIGWQELMQQLLQLEVQPMGLQHGKAAAASVAGFASKLEFGRVTGAQITPLVHFLLGTLHMRYATLWPACSEALAMALQTHPDLAWPPLLNQLQEAQRLHLSAARQPLPSGEEGHRALPERFNQELGAGLASAGGGSTQPSTVFTHLLKALKQTASQVLEAHSKHWMPMFLQYSSARANTLAEVNADAAEEAGAAGTAPGSSEPTKVGGKAWRAGLTEWLQVLGSAHSFRSLATWQTALRAAASHLQSSDNGVQQAALMVLKGAKLSYLTRHADKLMGMADDKSLRRELASFPLASTAPDPIPTEDRPGLVPVLVHLLWPRLRKRSGKQAKKGGAGSGRTAVLHFLAGMEPAELRHLVQLVLQPVSGALRGGSPEDVTTQASHITESEPRLFDEPWWSSHLGREDGSWWLAALEPELTQKVPLRARQGFVNAMSDLLTNLGHQLQMYLPELTALLLSFAHASSCALQAQGSAGDEISASSASEMDSVKDIRNSALRMLAEIWQRFPSACSYSHAWKPFADVAEPLLSRTSIEASSSKPPPLVLCTAALTASPTLASVLDGTGPNGLPRELGHRMVGACIQALALPSCSSQTRSAVLTILESLLDSPLSTLCAALLKPHTDVLAGALQTLIAAAWSKDGAKGKKPAQDRQPGAGRHAGMRGLAVLERVVDGVEDHTDAAQKLTEVLLTPLQHLASSSRPMKGQSQEQVAARCLRTLAALWKRGSAVPPAPANKPSGQDRGGMCAERLAPLSGKLTSAEARAALTGALAALAGLHPDVAAVTPILAGLDAMVATSVDEVDYDRRIDAYGKLHMKFWSLSTPLQATLLLHRCLADLRNSSDLSLRHASAQALARFVDAAKPAHDASAAAEDRTSAAASGTAELQGLPLVLHRVVMPQIKHGSADATLAVRQEHVALMRAIAVSFPSLYPDLAMLTSEDAEVDFFNNIAHLQLHRRSRALLRLAKVMDDQLARPALKTIIDVIIPMVQQMIAEGEAAGGGEGKQGDRDRMTGVVDSAMDALKAVASSMPWSQYRQLLSSFLRNLRFMASESKASIRAVCTIIDAFHFPLPPKADAQEDNATSISMAAGDAAKAEGSLDAAVLAAAQDVQKVLMKQVLPALMQQLVKEGEVVRAPVALALVKLVRLLPERAERNYLPAILQQVANVLKLRLQRIRDDARRVLAAIALELGPTYLPQIATALSSALPPKGYTAQILGYTFNTLLTAACQRAGPGSLDPIIGPALGLMEADIFGAAGEARDAGVYSGQYREAKKNRAFDTYLLLARHITFRTHVASLLAPVRARLAEGPGPRARKQLENLLQHAVRGIAANPTATLEDLLVFVHGTLQHGLAQEARSVEVSQAAASLDDPDGEQNATAGAGRPRVVEEPLMMDMALQLLLGVLKKGLSHGPHAPADSQALLGPLLPLLTAALQSRHAPCTSLALRCLASLSAPPLPGLAASADAIGEGAAAILKKAGSAEAPIAQEGLRLMAALLRGCPDYQPPQGDLRFLLTWAFGDLAAAAHRATPFAFLKAILGRRLVVPEVYDLMGRVEDVLVSAQSIPVRQACASAMMQFLLDYPLGPKRLSHHLHHLLANLAYEHEEGRLAALEMLQTIIFKFPEPVLAEWTEVFFLPLVTRLVNDGAPSCRSKAGEVVRVLMEKVSVEGRDKLAGFCLRWLDGKDSRLRCAAAQAMKIQMDVEKAKAGRRVGQMLSGLLPLLLKPAQVTEAAPAAAAAELEAEAAAPLVAAGWQEVYHSLLLVERMAQHTPRQVAWGSGQEAQTLWHAVQGLLEYPHVWVRKASARLLGLVLASPSIGPGLLESQEGQVGLLARSCFLQLEADSADEALLNQALKCIVFLTLPLYEQDAARNLIPSDQPQPTSAAQSGSRMAGPMSADGGERRPANGHEPSNAEQAHAQYDERMVGDSDAELDTSDAAANGAANGAQQDLDTGDGDGAEGKGYWQLEGQRREDLVQGSFTLAGLVRRMSSLACDRSYPRQAHRMAALRFIAAFASRVGGDRTQPFLPPLLRPLFLITEGASPVPEEVMALGQEVLAHLYEVIGSDAVLKAFNAARRDVLDRRQARRTRQAVQVMVDPEAASKRKLKKASRQAAGRKRKLEDFRRQRSTGVGLKNKKSGHAQRRRAS
ncbi:hypothetical protein WJX74_009992 [Apatococcus lobatus]|uniref:Uncharacterized protein n=1 Tax=Apatococcus lobatus TaxID=904363 RepID=A0AAW1SCN1_9CHLO